MRNSTLVLAFLLVFRRHRSSEHVDPRVHACRRRSLDMRVEGPHWGGLRSLAPSVTFPDASRGSWQLTVVNYTPGLMLGVAILLSRAHSLNDLPSTRLALSWLSSLSARQYVMEGL